MHELLGEKDLIDSTEKLDDLIETVADPGKARILLADDSPIIRMGVEKLLRSRGFDNLVVCNDGSKA